MIQAEQGAQAPVIPSVGPTQPIAPPVVVPVVVPQVAPVVVQNIPTITPEPNIQVSQTPPSTISSGVANEPVHIVPPMVSPVQPINAPEKEVSAVVEEAIESMQQEPE
ncbi:MAG: hypothetical protein WCL18_08250 [bacterium]